MVLLPGVFLQHYWRYMNFFRTFVDGIVETFWVYVYLESVQPLPLEAPHITCMSAFSLLVKPSIRTEISSSNAQFGGAEWSRYRIVAVLVTSSSPVRRVGQRCMLNLSRAQTSSRWVGVVLKRRGASLGVT
ncbi:hypothetical protein TNCV_3732741 [Trichonephila clavipes]|nr:hypothetical protein TNCV_3732741 [Trichonephila clavipes]